MGLRIMGMAVGVLIMRMHGVVRMIRRRLIGMGWLRNESVIIAEKQRIYEP